MADNNVLIEYSEFFNNDGGFEKVKSDFKSLGEDLKKEAIAIKKEVNGIFDLSNSTDLSKYEKITEQLLENFNSLEVAKKSLDKTEKTYNKTQKKTIKATSLQTKNLAELEQELSSYKKRLKENNKEEKKGTKTIKASAEERSKLRLKIKQVTQEINKQQKEIIESNKLSKSQEKLLKAEITLQENRASTIEEVRERLSALRIVASKVNIETEEGKRQVAEYNNEINELTDVLEENSDKFIKSKINIGNYEESILNALKNTSIFSTNIGVLDDSLSSLVSILTLNKEELKEMSESLKDNNNAVTRFAVAFGKLNNVLKASIIGAVLIAVASIGSAFNQGRAGIVRTEKLMNGFNASLRVVINTMGDFYGAMKGVLAVLFSQLGNISDKFELFVLKAEKAFFRLSNPLGGAKDKIKEIEEQIESLNNKLENNKGDFSDKIKKAIGNVVNSLSNFSSRYNDAKNSIVTGNKAIEDSFKFSDKIKKAKLELVDLVSAYELLELRAGDSTISLKEQLKATRKALEKNLEIIDKENDIRKKQLALANTKARADLKAAVTTIGAEAKRIANIKDEIKFSEELLALNTRLGTLKNPLNDELLSESNEALLEYKRGLNDRIKAREESAKMEREIERDIFEQNLDFLFDEIDNQKKLSEQYINDITKNFKDRVQELDRFVKKFRINAQKELDEFNKLAVKSADLIETQLLEKNLPKEKVQALKSELEKLKDIDLKVVFDDKGGFKVFNKDVEITVDDIAKLNKELQDLGLAEIPINRFKEFRTETTNGVKDFAELNKSLAETKIKINELKSNLVVDEDELKRIRELEEKITKLNSIDNFNNLSQKQRNKILEELKSLEKQKTEIEKEAERERLENRLKAIDEELKRVEKGSEAYFELMRERRGIEKSISTKNLEEITKEVNDANNKAIERWKKYQKEVRRITNMILDKLVDNGKEQVSEQEKAISKQEKRVETQRKRANEGLENTLKFEQEKRVEQEAELIKRNKRLERLEKIKSVYSSYSNYANSGEKNPLAKALRDFAILEAITASFEDGGIVGVDGYSKVRTNKDGITTGRRHNMKGGVLAYHEGGEGFLSRKEMANLGVDNFRAIKDRASLGALDKNFFGKQQKDFIQVINQPKEDNNSLATEVREIRKVIKNKPAQTIDVEGVVDGVLKFTETIKKGNNTKRNHFRIKKPRI